MKEQIKNEFERAVHSKMVYLSLIVGLLIAGAQYVSEVLPAAKDALRFCTGQFDQYPVSVFVTWIGGNPMSPYSLTYRTVLPIMATLPFALSYLSDIKSGYVKNVFSRTKRINYLFAKYLVTFVTAGAVVVIPYLLNLYATAMVLPSLTPVRNGYYMLRAISIMENKFYTKPYLYIFLYLIIYFIYAGVFAAVALAVAKWVDNLFLVSLVPFIIFYMTRIIAPYVRNISWLGMMDAIVVLNMCQTTGIQWSAVVLIPLCVGGISTFIYFVSGVRNDAF